MSAGGMAADHERPAELCEFAACRAHLANDVVDRNIRTEVVARHGDRDAVRVQPARAVAEEGAVERLPVAAMDEHHDRPVAAVKDVDGVAAAGSIGQRARRVLLAIGRRVLAQPAISAGCSGTRARLLYSTS